MNDDPFSLTFLAASTLEKISDLSSVKKELKQGKFAQDILELSLLDMAEFYKIAYQLFEKKNYRDSANVFLLLASLCPHNYDYWIGVGMGVQMCHEYEVAIDAYELAALMDITSPVPYFYLAKCFFAIHDHENALQSLDLAIEAAEDKEEFEDLKMHAISAKSLLLKNK